MKKYDLPSAGRAMIRRIFPGKKAPSPNVAPMQNGPGQDIDVTSPQRQPIDYSLAGPVLNLMSRLRHLETVQIIPVRQHAYIPEAPVAPVGAKTLGIPDQRYGITAYPEDRARDSYVFGMMISPAAVKSVPGYVAKQPVVNRTSQGYPTSALRAPRAASGGGTCDDC